MLLFAFLALIPMAAAFLGYVTLGEPYRPVFKRHKLPIAPNWPKVSIVHISDLHVRRGDMRLYATQKAALRGLEPDLLCVTGDVCEQVKDIQLVVDLLREVRPRLGTFVVLGNHEHNAHSPEGLKEKHARGWRRWLGAAMHVVAPKVHSGGDEEAHAMGDALSAAGITVLHNQGARVTVDGTHGAGSRPLESLDQSLWIAGCDSAWAGHADMLAATRGRLPSEPCLALIHEPDMAFEAQALGADLILAGHTHGGQVRFPLVGAPYDLKLDPRIAIAAGFQRIGEGLLHITAGLGHTIPLRFLCPPEVVWLDCEPDRVSDRSSTAPVTGTRLRGSGVTA
ncbi:MAG: metallophosphoesterase [Chloroflexi bacterium]|nr:metallophosphoesterase [Chloroflexota bacterium]